MNRDHNLVIPPRLKKGDTIGLVSISSPSAGMFPHRVEHATKTLKALGIKVKLGKNALRVTDYTAGTPAQRAADINAMFADPDVQAIMCMIGGNHSNQLVDLLDYELIRAHPKIFVGYSDATVLHHALRARAGLTTYYGPAAITQFAENPTVLAYTWEYFQKAVMSDEPIGAVTASAEWTDENLDWSTKKDLERPRSMKKNTGYVWLNKGSASGPMLGGCIASLMHLRGTDLWPNLQGAVFFWEISEGEADFTRGDSIANVATYLADLKLSHAFDSITGMIVGRPYGYTPEEHEQLLDLLHTNFAGAKFPTLFNVDIGHSDPMITVPLGATCCLDSDKNLFELAR